MTFKLSWTPRGPLNGGCDTPRNATTLAHLREGIQGRVRKPQSRSLHSHIAHTYTSNISADIVPFVSRLMPVPAEPASLFAREEGGLGGPGALFPLFP